MGRVSRYKKIKSCDPFYRGPRREISRLSDQRPENEEEQPVPKSLVRLMRSAQDIPKTRRKQNELRKGEGSTTRPASRLKPNGKDSATSQGAEKDTKFHRREGETLKAYLERIDVETNARIMETFRKNRKMSDRRKRYLEERRKKWRKNVGEDSCVEFSDLKDEVKFGEVVSAPPRLSAKPRGHQGKERKEELLLHEKLKSATPDTMVAKKPKQSVHVGLKRKQDLEMERDRVIQLYRQTKKANLSRMQDRTMVL